MRAGTVRARALTNPTGMPLRENKKKKKMRKPKDRSTPTPRTSTDDSICTVKFTTEQLYEAQGIIGAEEEGQEDTDSQQKDPEESVATAMGLVRCRERMVDEVIASLQRGGSDMSSVSDQMIKELMGRVLGDHRMNSLYFYVGDSYNADKKETKTAQSKSEDSEQERDNISPVRTGHGETTGSSTPQMFPVPQRML